MSKDETTDFKTDATEQSGVMQDESKRDKFLQLLGGKKPQNKEATANWLKKSRTNEDEKVLAEGLEHQYTTQMTHVVQGKTRRHEGIGFELPKENVVKPVEIPPVSPLDNRSRTTEKEGTIQPNRHRSRSPIDRKKTEAVEQKVGETENNSKQTVTNKKQFYMQFKKSTE
uniref:Small acidic protein n=1 Tax=Phallusia mammillata TaxID=59560 RepID=A0A6F9D7A7_9ASCI|nr:small acidic protein [Phallusia mammillata]